VHLRRDGTDGSTLLECEAPHGLFATHTARSSKDLLDFIAPLSCSRSARTQA
jgi:hypothetical protein